MNFFKNLKKNIDNGTIFMLNSYLLILFPWMLITGPFLSDLIISLSGLIFIIESICRRMWFYYKKPLVWAFGIFYFYLLARSLLSVDIMLSLESSIFYFRYLFFVLAIIHCCDHHSLFIKRLSYSGIIALIIVSLDGYLQYFTGYNSLMMKQLHPLRVSGFFGEELILGSYLSRLIPIFFGLYLFIHRPLTPKYLFPILLLLILVDVLVFIAGERTALFNLSLFTLALMICSSQFKLLRSLTFLISLSIMSILLYFNPVHKERMINQTITQMGLQSDTKFQIFSEQHQAHYITALKMFQDNPLFGQGPKLFRKLCSQKPFFYPRSCSTHPHHTYLQLMAEGGIIAAIPIFIFFLYLICLLARQALIIWTPLFNEKKLLSDTQICLILAILISLNPLVPSNSFFTNWIGGIYYLPLGILFSKTVLKKLN